MAGTVVSLWLLLVSWWTMHIQQGCHGGVLPDEDVDNTMKTIKLWPNGRIPYEIPDGSYSDYDRGLLLVAMRRWEERTCVKFEPLTDPLSTTSRESYVKLFSQGRCFSKIGVHKFQPQLLGIGQSCMKLPMIIHELGHTLGLVHTMERDDRDWYIDILTDNLNPDSAKNYATTKSRNIRYPLFDTPYDYKSIMHYGPKAWSSNGKPVIVTKDPAYYDVIGKSSDVSFFDALFINRAYNCSAKCSRSLAGLCRNGGFLGGPNCRCICQDGYTGVFCDQPLPGYDKIIDWQCQRGWEFHEGRCFRFETSYVTSYAAARAYCAERHAHLFAMKSRPEIEWLIRKSEDQRLLTRTRTFWIGLTTNKTDPNMKWEDGSFVDQNLVSLVNVASKEVTRCAQFNGESVILTGCDVKPDNGFICVKDFDAACGGRYTIGAKNVTIQSPGFPDAYPEDTECSYVLQAHDSTRIRLSFSSFHMETNCKNDYVEVRLTNDLTADGQRYCGTQLNGLTLTSEGNLAIITLKTNARGSATGFQAMVSEIRFKEWTTPSPFTVLDSILNAFSAAKGKLNNQQERWSIKSLFEILKAFTFSKVL